jgi:hypothetical protein
MKFSGVAGFIRIGGPELWTKKRQKLSGEKRNSFAAMR